MRKADKGGRTARRNKLKRDNRGSAIVIVIIAMAMIGILATTILWASYLNYRIKISDLKVKNSFYSAETVVEQIMAGVKKDVVSASVNEAYQEVVSNWDALGTDANRESYFITAYTQAVEEKLGVGDPGVPAGQYDPAKLAQYVDGVFLDGSNATSGNIASEEDGAPYGSAADWVSAWKGQTDTKKAPLFRSFEDNRALDPQSGTMTLKNVRVQFYDSDGLLSVIETDIAIDVPKLRFTQAGTIDRLYQYVLVGDDGIVTEDNTKVTIDGSIYGGAYETGDAAIDEENDGIRIGKGSTVTVQNANYVISGGDIIVGTAENFVNLIHQDADFVVKDMIADGVGFRTNVYTQGLAVNGSHLSIAGKVFAANDLILSGSGSNVTLEGQYFGYGGETGSRVVAKNEDGTDKTDAEGRTVYANPAQVSSAIVINGKDSAVDLTGLTVLQLAGRAYVSLGDDDSADGLPHVLMGESISVKSNQIAYLVPPECIGTLDGKTVIGQNPMSFSTWSNMAASLADYLEEGRDFRIVNAGMAASKLGGSNLNAFGVGDITAADFEGVDPANLAEVSRTLNAKAAAKGVRFLYLPEKQQVYLYLVMDAENAEQYFAAYYNVNGNKASLDSYFNTYASGGIRLKENVQGYTVVGNSMVSLTDAGDGNSIRTNADGDKLVRLLSSVEPKKEEGEGGDGAEQPKDPDAYEEVSDNLTETENVKDSLEDLSQDSETVYRNLNTSLTEEEDGTALAATVFENLVQVDTPAGAASGNVGLKDYLAEKGVDEATFVTDDALKLKAVLKDGDYTVNDSALRLVIATGDVTVKKDFQGLILAGGTITVENNATCTKNGEDVYKVLQAGRDPAEDAADTNVPANILCNGSGMVLSGYEGAEADALGNLAIDYSEIVRYENWIKK